MCGALFANPPGTPEWLPGRMNTNVQVGFSFQLANPESLPPALRPLADPKFLATQPDITPSASLKAWDPVNHKVVWSFQNSSFMDHGGVLSTGGGLVVQGGLDGKLRVFKDTDGELLKEIEVGTAMIAAPCHLHRRRRAVHQHSRGQRRRRMEQLAAAEHRVHQGQCEPHPHVQARWRRDAGAAGSRAAGPVARTARADGHACGYRGGRCAVRRQLRQLPQQCVAGTDSRICAVPPRPRMPRSTTSCCAARCRCAACRAGTMCSTQTQVDQIHAYVISVARAAWDTQQAGLTLPRRRARRDGTRRRLHLLPRH